MRMLYTRKGDGGKTGIFGCNQKISKSSPIAEALGSCDEINSLLGVCKMKAKESEIVILDDSLSEILGAIQQDLFIVQAELAGSDKKIVGERVIKLENWVDEIETRLPKITTFFVSGGTELAAHLDYARTIARRAERRVVAVNETQKLGEETLRYINRLSSILYATARLVNHVSGIKEESPKY